MIMRKTFIACICIFVMLFTFSNVVIAAMVDRISKPATGFNLITPPNNKFSIAGNKKEFVLLDVDINGDCFVLANDYYGTKQYDIDLTAKFDPLDSNNIAYFLNNQFLQDGNSVEGAMAKLPSEIIQFIDKERNWNTEAGSPISNVTKDYSITAGVVLLSQTEWLKYITKFGDFDPSVNIWGYWLRTARGKSGGSSTSILCARVTDSNGTTNSTAADKSELIRPAFYLKKDFFLNVKLNVDTLGLSIKKLLKLTYKQNDFKKIYSDNEINTIFSNLPPQAENVNSVGFHYVGQKMTGVYKYDDTEGDIESGTTFRWLRESPGGSKPLPIDGEEKPEYLLTESDIGNKIYLEVTPSNANQKGSPVLSNPTKIIKENLPPVALRSKILGYVATDERLIGYYDYADPNEDAEKATVYQWYRGDNLTGDYTKIDGAIDQTYIPTKNDVNKYLKLQIIPHSSGNVNNIGEAEMSGAVGPVKALDFATATFTGESFIGSTLNGKYTYRGYGSLENKVTPIWLISDVKNEGFREIDGETNDSYIIKPTDFGRYIAFGTKVENGKISISDSVLIGTSELTQVNINKNCSSLINRPTMASGFIYTNTNSAEAELYADGIDFVNSATFLLKYDPTVLKLKDIDSAINKEFSLVTGKEGAKVINISLGGNKAGLSGRALIAKIRFDVLNNSNKTESVSIENLSLYKAASTGDIADSCYDSVSIGATEKRFSDIPEGTQKEKIIKLAQSGIINGTSFEIFEPQKNVTRAEFAAFVIRALRICTTSYQKSFKDVTGEEWYADIIETINRIGIMKGNNGFFKPNDVITHYEIEILVDRMNKLFATNKIKSNFEAANNCTRLEATVIISQILEGRD